MIQHYFTVLRLITGDMESSEMMMLIYLAMNYLKMVLQ